MAIVLFDTNILIDNFTGIREAVVELTNYKEAVISSITRIEVACRMDQGEKQNFKTLLAARKALLMRKMQCQSSTEMLRYGIDRTCASKGRALHVARRHHPTKASSSSDRS